MADGQSEFEILAKATLDENAERLMKLMEGDKTLTIKIQATPIPGGAQAYRAVPGYGAGAPANSNMPGIGPASTFNVLNVQHMREAIKFYKQFPLLPKALGNFSSTLEGMMDNLVKIARGGALGAVGGAAGLAAGAAAFTLERAGSFRDKAAQALGFGVTPYTPEAFVNNLKMETGGQAGVQALFGGLVQQQTTIGGPAYLKNFLNRFGVKTTGKESQEELAADVLRAERVMAQTIQPQLWQKYAEIFKVGSVVDTNTLMRLKGESKGTLEEHLGKALDEAKGGAEGKNLIELQTEWNNNLIDLGKRMDRVADAVAGWLLALKGGALDDWVRKKGKELGIPGLELHEPKEELKPRSLEQVGKDFKGLWDGLKSLFGVSPAKAGELPAGVDTAAAAKVPANIQDIRDILARDSVNAGSMSGSGLGAGYANPMLGAGAGPGRTAGGTYSGDIKFPSDRRGRTGSAGFGLYASDVGLAVNKSLSAQERAFLDTFATGETPSGSYSNVDHDPGGLGGRYQFLKSTWVNWARKAGLDPGQFSPENQDKVALLYASSVVKDKTGKDLNTLLSSGPDGVRQAIAAISPGAWNAITNIDRDKRGHSGAVALFIDKLKKEQAAEGAAANATKDQVKKADGAPPANIHIPNVYHGGQSSEYPAPGEKSGSAIPGPQSLNNMNLFQQEKGAHIRISNTAGASVTVQSAMLGAVKGSYG